MTDGSLEERRPPFFPRPVHVVIGVMLAIAAVAGIVNAVVADRATARVVHGGIAVGCVVWSLIELTHGGRARP